MINELQIEIYADGASLDQFEKLNNNPLIKGFTTNPSLMKKNGITDYKSFAKDLLKIIKNKPVSFEVFADELQDMERQANEINSWGENVYVKLPITNTKSISVLPLIKKLQDKRVKLNITAVFTKIQIDNILGNLDNSTPSIVSIFCGRIADTGRYPAEYISYAKKKQPSNSNIKILWASTRELLNIFEADKLDCDIITVPDDMLNKLNLIGKNLDDYSLETVKSFYFDAKTSNYSI